jgi:hypothetical protein
MLKIEMTLLKQKQDLKNVFLKLVGNILRNLHNVERNFTCVGRGNHPALKMKLRNVFIQKS